MVRLRPASRSNRGLGAFWKMPGTGGGELVVNLQRAQSRGKTVRLGLGVAVAPGELQEAVGMLCFQREPVPCAVESSQ